MLTSSWGQPRLLPFKNGPSRVDAAVAVVRVAAHHRPSRFPAGVGSEQRGDHSFGGWSSSEPPQHGDGAVSITGAYHTLDRTIIDSGATENDTDHVDHMKCGRSVCSLVALRDTKPGSDRKSSTSTLRPPRAAIEP